jgi:starch synthase (maltosyl-transferring)
VNAIRRAHRALQDTRGLTFHGVDDDALLAYSRATRDGDDVILVVVNLDPDHVRAGWTDLDLDALGAPRYESFEVEDLLNGPTYVWQGGRNFVQLDPAHEPAHVFLVRGGAGMTG